MNRPYSDELARSVTLLELVTECAEALLAPAWDPDHWSCHVALLDGALESPKRSTATRELLINTRKAMHAILTGGYHPFDTPDIDPGLIKQLIRYLRRRGARRYVYHGTTVGRLASIARKGLVPQHKPVWRDEDLKTHCENAVFLCNHWRGAAWWADTTAGRQRGPRASRSRKQAVIRVPASGLAVAYDTRATMPGCLRVESVVSVEQAEFLEAPLKGFPTWTPIQTLLQDRKS